MPPGTRRPDGRFPSRLRLSRLLAWLLPSRCFGCGRPLGGYQHAGACSACWADLRLLPAPVCPVCALPAALPATNPGRAAPLRCLRCERRRPPACERVLALVVYDDLARRFLLRAKLGGRPELLDPLGGQLSRMLELDGVADEGELGLTDPG